MQTTKSIIEQIEVMTHYVNGGEVEFCDNAMDMWDKKGIGLFDWVNTEYRIKEKKKTITIEKWLVFIEEDNEYKILETSNINSYNQSIYKRIKLIDTVGAYEVEL